MSMLHRIVTFAAVGGLVGDFTSLALAPRIITWFHTPGVGGAMCDCAQLTMTTASDVVESGAIGTGVGMVAGVVVGEVVARFWLRRRAPKSAPTAPAS